MSIRQRSSGYEASACPPRAVVIGSDHAGYDAKVALVAHMKQKYPNIAVVDVGTFLGSDGAPARADYPDIASAACTRLQQGSVDRAILLDGAGVASTIAANKFVGVRAGLLHDHFTALMGRQHNDINCACFGGRSTGIEVLKCALDIFLTEPFEGERHVPRLDKLEAIEYSQGVIGGAGSGAGASAGRAGGGAQAASPFKLPL